MELSLAKPISSKPPPSFMLLKDHLLDDFSSCSSNGFRSYPRRQQHCCTTVRFLLELDLKIKPTKSPLKPSSSLSSTTNSIFHRASKAVINAVKSLPFASVKSSQLSKVKLGILPRSLSRKLLKGSFWKKKPIEHLILEKSSPVPELIMTVSGGGEYSNSSTSDSKSNYGWSDSDFTTSDNSLITAEKIIKEEVVVKENKKRVPEDEVVSSEREGVIVGDDSTDVTTSSNSSTNSTPNTTKKQWPNEEKEQFSPVSVLQCPFDEDEDEVSSSSPFQHRRLARMEGTKKSLMKKIKRFERLNQLEPTNLVKRIALSESDQESNESPLHHSSESIQEDFVSEEENEEAVEKPIELLELIKDTMPSISFKTNVEKLLFDFFKVEIHNGVEIPFGLTSKDINGTSENDLLHIAKDWLNGNLLEWEVQKNREAYIRDMERGGEWKNLDKEIREVALEIEVEFFASLMNELLDYLLS